MMAKIDRKPFEGDLRDGQAFEFLAARAVVRDLHAIVNFLDGKETDIELYIPQRAEVKTDYMARKTGNIYIESENTHQGLPSGIGETDADIWIHCIPHLNKAYWFYVQDMRRHLSEPNGYRTVQGGDENSFGILIPIEKFQALDFVRRVALS